MGIQEDPVLLFQPEKGPRRAFQAVPTPLRRFAPLPGAERSSDAGADAAAEGGAGGVPRSPTLGAGAATSQVADHWGHGSEGAGRPMFLYVPLCFCPRMIFWAHSVAVG